MSPTVSYIELRNRMSTIRYYVFKVQ